MAAGRRQATGRRKILKVDDRVDVLKRIDNGESCRSIAAANFASCDVFQVLTLNVLIYWQ